MTCFCRAAPSLSPHFSRAPPPPPRPSSHQKGQVSFLQVGVPAWVEFLNRETRQGQLAFIVSVRGTPLNSSTNVIAGSSLQFNKSKSEGSKSAPPAGSGEVDDISPPPPLNRGSSVPVSSIKPTADTGEVGNAGSSAGAVGPAWTCLRTWRELSAVVHMYRRCVETYVREGGQWQARERPRVLKHMGTADQVGPHERTRFSTLFFSSLSLSGFDFICCSFFSLLLPLSCLLYPSSVYF